MGACAWLGDPFRYLPVQFPGSWHRNPFHVVFDHFFTSVHVDYHLLLLSGFSSFFTFLSLLLSFKLSSVISRFEAFIGGVIFEPSLFVISIPVMYTADLFRSTLSTLPVMPLKLPLMIFTLSPLLKGSLLVACLLLNSFERWAPKNLRLTWIGA